MTSPNPVPPYLRVVDVSAWVKGWKSLSICSLFIPIPVSRTENCNVTWLSDCSISSVESTISPCSVNLIALSHRFTKTWPSLSASPSRKEGTRESRFKSTSRFSFSWVLTIMMLSTLSRASVKSKFTCSMSRFPDSILEKSRMSLMTPRRDLAEPSILFK